MIAPNGELEDVMIPIDNAKFLSGVGTRAGQWIIQPLYHPKQKMSEAYMQYLIQRYPTVHNKTPEEEMARLKEKADLTQLEDMIGQKFGVILTVEVEGSKKAYTIYNTVESVKEVRNEIYKSVYRADT